MTTCETPSSSELKNASRTATRRIPRQCLRLVCVVRKEFVQPTEAWARRIQFRLSVEAACRRVWSVSGTAATCRIPQKRLETEASDVENGLAGSTRAVKGMAACRAADAP